MAAMAEEEAENLEDVEEERESIDEDEEVLSLIDRARLAQNALTRS